MRQHERERLMTEVADLVAADRVPMADSTMENEVYRYTDPAYASQELSAAFATSPRVLALSAQLPQNGDFVLERTAVIEQPINWKFIIDGFLETYHIRFLHESTLAPFVRSNFGPTKEYGPNVRMVILRASYDEHVTQADGPVDPMPHIGVAYQLFPNTVVVWQGPHMEVWTSYPTAGAPDHCSIRVSVLAPEPTTTEEQQKAWDRNWAILMGTVLEEDFAVSRRAQVTYQTGAVTHLLDGRNEPALQAFHRNLASRMTSS